MSAVVVEPCPIAKSRLSMIGKLLGFFLKMPGRATKLDLAVMPDRVKRDLGLLDGRDPRYEDDRMR